MEDATYVANASIIIGSGGSLILQNGLHISFASNRGVYVMNGGALSVIGSTTFITNDIDVDWYGIILSTNNDTMLQYLTVTGAKSCMKQESSANGLISLESVTFQDCSQEGIRIDSQTSEVFITNSQVSNVGGYGIYSVGIMYLELVNSLVANCSNYGVYLYYAQNITVYGNTISQASSNAYSLYAYRPNEAYINSNDVQCWYACFYINFRGNKEAHIHNNTFSGLGNENSFRMAYVYGSGIYGDEKLIMTENTFKDWISPTYSGIDFHYSGRGNGLKMANNTFQDIQAKQILFVSLATYDEAANLASTFTGNFEHASSSSPALMYISNWYSNTANAHSSLIGNVFDTEWQNGTEQYAIIVNVNSDSVPEIDASYSYWGSDDNTFIPSLIYDGSDDYSYPLVKYVPYLLTSDINGPISNITDLFNFVKPGSMLSGTLPEDEVVHLTSDDSPYQSEGTLTIDGDLFVHENVTINMKSNSKLIIRKGSLVAIGTQENPITFDKQADISWRGIEIDHKFRISNGYRVLLAYTSSGNSFSVGKEEFNALFNNSTSKILYRHCPYCTSTHRNIFYKRLTNSSNFDAYEAMTCSWTSENNTLNTDFGKIFKNLSIMFYSGKLTTIISFFCAIKNSTVLLKI